MTASIADIVAPQLPYLRRFARALTGSQESGDAYVVAMLETLVADQRNFRHDMPPRAAIYQSFIRVWSAMPMNREARMAELGAGGVIDRRIETMTPLPRQAFLLAAVEEFSNAEIGLILDLSEAEVSALIAAAGREIAQQIAVDVLIIEEEPLIALEIETLVSDIGHRVAGIAQTRTEAIKLARAREPGLVLADIQLADGSSGIDAVNDILKTVAVPVIFITAYPERLLSGERAEPVFLVSKPFHHNSLKAIISQALFFEVKAASRVPA
jgi:DNA-directed RNA polymerase specialized sigma24 family protein/CheY-like chemotaxis protein